MSENADLLYAGRDRKRPPGASDLAQRIWLLLREYPRGLTRDEIQRHLAEGWLDTDAYREYENGLHRGPRARVPAYGTAEFKERAQKTAIRNRLKSMQDRGTVRREGRPHLDGIEGSLWFAARPPRVTKIPDRAAYVPLTQIIDNRNQVNRGQVAREYLKAACRTALEDKRSSKGHQALAQQVLDYLNG